MNTINRICVFCASSRGSSPIYEQKARELGKVLLDGGITLIYGGGNRGNMGIIADTISSGGGQAIGVLPEVFNSPQVCTKDVETERIITKDMHERKKTMYDMADGFIAMPGGIGTYEEFFEIFTWLQIGLHHKPIALLNINSFFDPVIASIQHCIDEGFAKQEILDSLIICDDPEKIIDLMREKTISLSSKI